MLTEPLFLLQICFGSEKGIKNKRQIVSVQLAQHLQTQEFRGPIPHKWVQTIQQLYKPQSVFSSLLCRCLLFQIFSYIKFIVRGRASCVKLIVHCLIFYWNVFDPVELSTC